MIRIQKCTVREFGELIKEKQVICFGGGQRLLDICEAYTMGGQLFYIVDKYKSGTRIEIGERKVPVLSMEQIGEEIKKSVPGNPIGYYIYFFGDSPAPFTTCFIFHLSIYYAISWDYS